MLVKKATKFVDRTTTSHLDIFQQICQAELGIVPEREYKFHPTRKWRADYHFQVCNFREVFDNCFAQTDPTQHILVEIEGITYRGKGTRHQRGAGYAKDLEKYNAAQLLGYRVFRFTPRMIKSGYAIETLKEALK